jgi:hemin uptake protein HemP
MTLPLAPNHADAAAPANRSPEPSTGRPPCIDSAALFAGAQEVIIRHGGREYRLRRTRLGKLILTA